MAFAHATCPLSVTDEYLALGSGLPGFMPPSTTTALLGSHPEEGSSPFVYRSFTFCGGASQRTSTNMQICNSLQHMQVLGKPPYNPR